MGADRRAVCDCVAPTPRRRYGEIPSHSRLDFVADVSSDVKPDLYNKKPNPASRKIRQKYCFNKTAATSER
jgi:hypothetical protein